MRPAALDGVAQPPVIADRASPTPFRLAPTATPTATETLVPTLTPTLAVPATPTPTVALPSPTPTLVPPTPTPSMGVMGPGTYNDDSPFIAYPRGNWILIASLHGTDASYRYSEDADAEAAFAFEGTAARVQYVSFRNFGIFEVLVDGVLWTVVDSYAPAGAFGREVVIDGLPYGEHTVTLRNTGQRNPASGGTVIALDAIHIPQSPAPTPTLALQSLGEGSGSLTSAPLLLRRRGERGNRTISGAELARPSPGPAPPHKEEGEQGRWPGLSFPPCGEGTPTEGRRMGALYPLLLPIPHSLLPAFQHLFSTSRK